MQRNAVMAVHPRSVDEVIPFRPGRGTRKPDLPVWGLLVYHIGSMFGKVNIQYSILLRTR